MAIYKDGPLWVEGNPGEKPKLKTFLSATKEEMLEHGFTQSYKDCYEITRDGKLTYVKEEMNPFWFPILTMLRESPDRLSRFYGHADAILWYAIGKNNHTNEPTFRQTEKSLEMEVGPFNPRVKGLYLIKHSFEFRQGVEDLFQSLSDVDAIIQMAESMKGLSVLSSVEIDVKKQDELLHVSVTGAPIKWSIYDHCSIERDVSAQNMDEFLPQLQKAELEYCDAELKFLKDIIESQRARLHGIGTSKTSELPELETEEELVRLTELVKQTQSQKEIVEQSLNEEEEEELDDRGR
ncbi:hypothetical protein ACKX2L_06585 [Lachnospiraceae bacterium YH-ros2228]